MKCYEYFNCPHTQCIARTDDRHCWQISRTHCYKGMENIKGKCKKTKYGKYDKTICVNCPYRVEIFKPKK